jgi:choline dehydrogenase-like flavoprotein
MADNTYDAIVIGSGISGGWAAKELTEKGLKVLMLERGRNIEHIKDYVNANKEAWDYPHRGHADPGDDQGLSCFEAGLSPE